MNTTLHRAPLTVALALALSACGGGGGTKSNPPSNPPSQPAPPPVQTCDDPTATNAGQPKPCTYRYNGTQDNLLVPTNVDQAHAAGYTGKGVKVGVLDTQYEGDYGPLEGRIHWYKDFAYAGSTDSAHSWAVTAALAGRSVEGFKGGVAPEADVYLGAICDQDGCSTGYAWPAVAEMVAQDVRLFNFSIGSAGNTEAETEAAARGWSHSLNPILSANGLLITATANEGKPQPSSTSLMPVYLPEWQDHIIAVAAGTVDASGKVSELESYSNACGRAAQWCLTAPGLVKVPPVEGTLFEGGLAAGTSMAAPSVTGAAALVLQAYPWMTAYNLQQTLLTTATDLGEPGVDATFGWGLLNTGKAVRGPAVFVRNFVADIDAGSYTFANDISGSGGLFKTGAGALILTGRNTYTGLSEVEGGLLALANGTAGSVKVYDGAAFQGAGTIGGDYTAKAGSITVITIGKPLQVAGHAELDGRLDLQAPESTYAIGSTERLLGYGSHAGAFTDVTYGSGFFYTAALNYGAEELTATLSRTSAETAAVAAGSAPAVVEGARMADALLDYATASPAGAAGIGSVAGKLASAPTVAVAEASLGSLAAEVYGTARAVAVQQAVAADQMLADRVATLDPAAAGVWVTATGQQGAFERSGYADADWRTSGLAVGVDRDFGSLLAGASLSTGRNKADLDAVAGDFDADTTGLNLYARLDLDATYLSATFGYGRSDVDTQRTLLLGDEALSVTGRHKDTTRSVRVELGREVLGGVTPFAAAGWVNHKQGAFAEEGGRGLGLTAGEDGANVHYGEVGARLGLTHNNFAFRALLAGRWLSGDTLAAFTGSFTGAPDVQFAVRGQQVPGHAARVSGGFDYAQSARSYWSVDLGAEKGAGDSSNAYISAGYRYAF